MIKVCLHIIFLQFKQFTFAQLQLGRSVIWTTGSDSLNIQNASCIGRSNGFVEIQTITGAGIEPLDNDSKRNINMLTFMVKAISNSGNTNMNGTSKKLDFVRLVGHNLWIQDILTIHLIS